MTLRCATKHRHTTPMAAVIVAGAEGVYLDERHLCRDCGKTLERRTALRAPGEWRHATGSSSAGGVLYACIPPGKPDSLTKQPEPGPSARSA